MILIMIMHATKLPAVHARRVSAARQRRSSIPHQRHDTRRLSQHRSRHSDTRNPTSTKTARNRTHGHSRDADGAANPFYRYAAFSQVQRGNSPLFHTTKILVPCSPYLGCGGGPCGHGCHWRDPQHDPLCDPDALAALLT
jgi:hypothetical protein